MAAFARRDELAHSSFASWVLNNVRQGGRSRAVRFAEVELPGGDICELRGTGGAVDRGVAGEAGPAAELFLVCQV